MTGMLAMTGMLEGIYITRRAGTPMESRQSVRLEAGFGIIGDRYHGVDPQSAITLIEAEQIDHFNATYGLSIPSSEFRRNLVVRGLKLNALVGKVFTVGGLEVRAVELCEPCASLGEQLSQHGPTSAQVVKSLVHRAGLRCEILSDGVITLDDEVADAVADSVADAVADAVESSAVAEAQIPRS